MKRVGCFIGSLLSLAIIEPAAAHGVPSPDPVRGVVYDSPPPMNHTVQTRLRPQVVALLEQLIEQERGLTLDGQRVFGANDRFLPGKIALGMAYLITETPAGDPRLERYLAANRRLAELTLQDPNETWGLYYYALALHQLKTAGLLERAVAPATLAELRRRLDWRVFVRPSDLTLINLPNNYYGVAFSLARLRHMLGWEDVQASEALLARTLDHYRTYSGEFGFADETDGQGRFDRYSVLLVGEIAQRFIEAGLEPPAEVRQWLRKSVDVLLPRLNLRGEGWEYGRSIGAYGETAFLEVLSAAAYLKVLTPEEARMAYAFSSRVTARYADFWIDRETGSVNLWDDGRRTDAYRGKHRILGENLSLARQHVYTNAIWNRAGFQNVPPSPEYARWLARLPRATTTWFARGEYDRALITRRDLGRVVSLPLINGGPGQHMHNPYFPVPFSPGMLSGSADAAYPHLLPRITLADGAQLAGLAYFRDVQVDSSDRRTVVTYRQTELDRLGGPAPVKDPRLGVETRYVLEPGRITRTDRYIPTAPLQVRDIELEFASFSQPGRARGGDVRFGPGAVRRFSVQGLDGCTVQPAGAEPYRSPVGPFASRVRCTAGARTVDRPFTVSWTLSYAPDQETRP